MTVLVGQHGVRTALACRLLGHSRQAFYQSKADVNAELSRDRLILSAARSIREEDPRIGCRKLWLMLCQMFGHERMPGRDRFFVLLRRYNMMLPPPKPRHTTNSNHRYHKWKNLTKGLVPLASGQLWVADITYIDTADGACYLHLVTDAYSHKIVGWVLAETLAASASIEALRQAIAQATAMSGSDRLTELVHHSDRGVQYCCDAYVTELRQHGIRISMTEDYNPTDNAIAERANGIIKTECVYPRKQFKSFEHALNVIGNFIHFYNYQRPHMSIGGKVPALVHMERGEQKKLWKPKVYGQKETMEDKNSLPLPSRTTDWATAQAGAADQKDGCAIEAHPSLPNERTGLGTSGDACQRTQDGLERCVNYSSTALINTVNKVS